MRWPELPKWAAVLPVVAAAEIAVLVLYLVGSVGPGPDERLSSTGSLISPISPVFSEPPASASPGPTSTLGPDGTDVDAAGSPSPGANDDASQGTSEAATSTQPTASPGTAGPDPTTAPDAAPFTTVVASATVAAGESLAAKDVRCPSGYRAVGGGVQSDPAGSKPPYLAGSSPLFGGADALDKGDGTHGPADGWRGEVRNDAANERRTFKVAVTCTTIGDLRVVIRSRDAGTANATCPSGYGATGGGAQTDAGYEPDIVTSAPAFPDESNIGGMDDGTHGAPSGWDVRVRPEGSAQLTVRAIAVCSRPSAITTVLAGGKLIDANSWGGRSLRCPADHAASGGGMVNQTSRPEPAAIVGSSPLLTGGAQLLDTPDGTRDAPWGWRNDSRTADAGQKSYKAAVICMSV